jgi:hypothetical protein
MSIFPISTPFIMVICVTPNHSASAGGQFTL